MNIDVGTLRELLRNLQGWRNLWEDTHTDSLPLPDGSEISLWDIEHLIEVGLPKLPPRQAEAIELCLIQGMKERDAAIQMGVSPTNPVAMYATTGMKKLIEMMGDGTIRPVMTEVLV